FPSSVKYLDRASHCAHHSDGSFPSSLTCIDDVRSSDGINDSNNESCPRIPQIEHASVQTSLGKERGCDGWKRFSGGRQCTGARQARLCSSKGWYAAPKSPRRMWASREESSFVFTGKPRGRIATVVTFLGIGLLSKVSTGSYSGSPNSS